MSSKKQYLKPEVVVSNYWNNNEQFADLFNAVLFDGEQVIKPDELEDVDTNESSIMENNDYAESLKASRDNAKVHKKSTAYSVELAILGLEGQELIHYAMPMRTMGYDYGSYKKQYDNNAGKYTTADGLTRDEFISKMKRTDKFVPVITIVIYYGEKPWDGATSLHEMLNIPKKMEKFVNDYKMILVEARENNLKLHNVNNRDLFELLSIIFDKTLTKNEAKEKAIKYGIEHNSDKSVVMTVAGITNAKIDYNAFERRNGDMCTLFEEIAEENKMLGKAEGRAEGIIETGYDFGLTDKEIIERLKIKLNISLQQAQSYLKVYKNKTE
jgi:hypothetical protein